MVHQVFRTRRLGGSEEILQRMPTLLAMARVGEEVVLRVATTIELLTQMFRVVWTMLRLRSLLGRLSLQVEARQAT
jgi:hypothetical protein